MYSVRVRDHMMIAHSFQGDVFGPAQALHGATFVVDLEMYRPTLDANGIVCDIGRLSHFLKALLELLNYKNLDEVDIFKGQNTTTEFLAGYLCGEVVRAIRKGELGEDALAVERVHVILHESHTASASCELPVSVP